MLKKIGILLPSLKFGGAERVALNLAKALKSEGIIVEIILMSYEGEYLSKAHKNFEIVNLNCDKTYKLPIKLIKYIKKNKPDAIISSFWKLNLSSVLVRLIYPKIKLILWEHALISNSSTSKWLYGLTASIFYQLATRVVAVSEGVASDIRKITLALNHKIIVIYNSIEPPEKLIFNTNTNTNTNKFRKKIIWVGRMDENKNPTLMIDAFASLNKEIDVSLTFIGDGLLRKDLEMKCQGSSLNNKVIFMGYQDNPYKFIADADILILTSNQEGFGNVIVEAMFCGLRVISTDCGEGVREILIDGLYGTIVPKNDPKALARSIENELFLSKDKNLQIYGASRFLPEKIAKNFIKILH